MPISHEEREETIRKIEAVIADCEIKSGVVFSQKLFDRGGLFGVLAATEAEAMALMRTGLFQSALRRLSELQQQEMLDFERNRRAVARKQDAADYDPKIGQD
ncbi:MAG: hypothetical protein HZA25_01840 [Candidatus Niyogibacteria bacterium]|nr:hypothetical protein [Candidatus Niyogibacteria bacterium]